LETEMNGRFLLASCLRKSMKMRDQICRLVLVGAMRAAICRSHG
jgi:hypothetical protein